MKIIKYKWTYLFC